VKILGEALKIAKSLEGTNPKFNIFAFLYDRNNLVSIGRNQTLKTSPLVYRIARKYRIEHWVKYPFSHAEVNAVARHWNNEDISGKERIVIVRFDKKGRPILAKPCNNCQTFLKAINITEVYYTVEDGFHNFTLR
jgi:deoxycytidylate deaminase